MNKNVLLFCLAIFLCTQAVKASGAGDYRTKASGDWSSAAIWEMYTGSKWVSAAMPPNNTNGVITIQNGHTVTVNDTTYADQVRVNQGAVLHVLNNILYLKNGAGYDLRVEGKLMIDAIARVSDDPVTAGSTVDYQGDTLIQGGGFQVDLTFDGPNPQFVKGSGYGANLTVNNAGNLTIIGSQSYNGANFIKGKIIVPGFFVVTQYRHVFTGANINRYIDGNVALLVYENAPLTFALPLGAGGHYSPVVFNVQKNIPDQVYYTVTLKDGAPAAATVPALFDRISNVRYVNITTDQPTSIINASLQMSYDATDLVADGKRLRIAQNVGGTWVNRGGTGNATTSTITTAVNLTTVGDFVLANTANTPLLELNHSIASGNAGLADVYKIRTMADGRLKLNLLAKSSAVTATLLDGDSATVLGTLPLAGGASGSLEKDGLAGGSYFVKLLPGTPGQLYTYLLSDSLFIPAEAGDSEPDSTIGQANSFTINKSTTGHIGYYYKNHRDTVDWFRLKPMATGRLQLTITSKNNNAVSLTLYNSTGTTSLGSVTAAGNTTATLQQPGLPKGTYYVKINAATSSQFAPYIFTDTLFIPSFAAGTVAENAATAGEGKGRITDVLLYPNPAPVQFHLQVTGAPSADGTVSLVLKNANGETVWSNARVAITSLSSLTVDVSKLPAGIYFLQVTDEAKTIITKKLIISR